MSKQTFFDLEEVTDETKYRLEEPVDYYVFYISATVSYYEDEDEDDWGVGFGGKVQKTTGYSKQIGHLDTVVHNSHFYSILKQLKETYSMKNKDREWFYRQLAIPHNRNIESVKVSYYKESIREIKICGKEED